MKIRQRPQEDLGFQIAPMCDVLLVLLIFFVAVTSASALRSDRDINLPIGGNATKKETARAEAVLNVKWSEEKSAASLVVESQVLTDLADITAMLAPRFKADPAYRVVIRADRRTPSELIENVMGACAEAGISDVTFSVLNRE